LSKLLNFRFVLRISRSKAARALPLKRRRRLFPAASLYYIKMGFVKIPVSRPACSLLSAPMVIKTRRMHFLSLVPISGCRRDSSFLFATWSTDHLSLYQFHLIFVYWDNPPSAVLFYQPRFLSFRNCQPPPSSFSLRTTAVVFLPIMEANFLASLPGLDVLDQLRSIGSPHSPI